MQSGFSFRKQTTACLAGMALAIAATVTHADVVVVVSAKSAVGSLPADQVGQIFLGKVATFPNGESAKALDLADTAIKDEFYRKVTGKDAGQLKSYWSQLIFTGTAKPPKSVPDSAEARKAIAGDPGLIGYISKSAVDSSVKVVLTP